MFSIVAPNTPSQTNVTPRTSKIAAPVRVRTYRSFTPVFSPRSEEWDPAPTYCHWSRIPRFLGRRPGSPLGSTQTAAYGAPACMIRPSADSSPMDDDARSIAHSSICWPDLAGARLYGASLCGSVRRYENTAESCSFLGMNRILMVPSSCCCVWKRAA